MNTAIQRTPLYAVAQELKARFTDLQGWQIPEVYTAVETEVDAARQGVVLADETPNGKLMVEGEEAEGVVTAAFDLPVLSVGFGAPADPNWIYCLRKDRFFVSTPPGEVNGASKGLVVSDAFVTVTDMTHGQAEIRVIGPASQDFLSKVCGLDFHASAFPNHVAKQSSVAKTSQLVIRRDIGSLPAFSLVGGQSLCVYLWNVLVEAGREWGLVPIGQAARNVLEGC